MAVTYLYTNCVHYTLCILDTHCNDDPGYTLLLPLYIITVFVIPCVSWIHIVMMTQGIHCCGPIYILTVFIILCVSWIHNVMMTKSIHY